MKIIKRILFINIAIIVIAGLSIGAIIGLDATISGRTASLFTNITYPGKDATTLRAYLAKPKTPGPHPAMIMIHEFYGLNEDIVSKANKLANEGYVVLAVDAYRNATTQSIPRAIYLVSTTSNDQIQDDIGAGFRYLENLSDVDPKRIGIMGFCFGGGQSLRHGVQNAKLAATVVFYGSLVTNPIELGVLRGPVLGIFGETDRAPSPEQAAAFKKALDVKNIKNQITVYPGVGHAFINSENLNNPGPAGDAWKELLSFLELNVKMK